MEVFEINKDGTGEIFQANGCSLIIRKKIIEELGGLFPEEYFAYSEDTFLCFKVKFRGLKIMHTSRSVVNHKGGGSSGKNKSSFLYFFKERNRLLNFLIFFPGNFLIKYIPFLIFNFFLKLFASAFSGKYSPVQLVKAYWWLISNHKQISKYRKHLKKMKQVSDDYVLKYISGKIFSGENAFEKFINKLSVFYCKLTGIRIMENQKSI
jgi:GT2 family glycosyltransferase